MYSQVGTPRRRRPTLPACQQHPPAAATGRSQTPSRKQIDLLSPSTPPTAFTSDRRYPAAATGRSQTPRPRALRAKGPTTSQPRATPWVKEEQKVQSPERAEHETTADASRVSCFPHSSISEIIAPVQHMRPASHQARFVHRSATRIAPISVPVHHLCENAKKVSQKRSVPLKTQRPTAAPF